MPTKPVHPLHGLVVAAHSPFHADGSLNLTAVEKQAAHYLKHKLTTVFVAGTTGECSSLTLDERRALAQRWSEVIRGTALKLVLHVGSNCLEDCRVFAAQAQAIGAVAISAFAPSYFKPPNLDTLVAWCAEVAGAAPDIPFYFYDIPALTGVSFSMPGFLTQGSTRIPTLAGIKFTNSDLMAYQFVLRADNGAWDVPFGLDEHLLGALAMGARGAVGSGYNFAAPIYTRLLRAFNDGDLADAREEQFRGAQLVHVLSSFGYMGAAKALMEMVGVPVGPARLPNTNPTAEQKKALRGKLEAIGFFEWIH
ncbi:MAG TPA: dihydrodipicolinate synthase family protein [Verrucomicrobiae bacterium]|nr:dihydrodipicolinate synthase family protein [Verrucomicrobiae bacterium]